MLKTTSELARDRCTSNLRILLFDLSIRGHHPSYIKYLIRYWQTQQLPGHLDIVTSPLFLDEHADVVALADDSQSIQFTPITAAEEAALRDRSTGVNRLKRSFQEWSLFCQYSAALKASESLILYFDTFQPPISLGMRSPCPFSGIYFRPTFHYNSFGSSPKPTPQKPSLKAWVQQKRETTSLRRVLYHPQLQTLFCLDPFAVQQMDVAYPGSKAVYLPDPVEIHPPVLAEAERLKAELGIEPNRKVCLLFGALTHRKGVFQLLDAISMLPPVLCQQLCVVLVGESKLVTELNTRMATIAQHKPVQFIHQYEFVADAAIPNYFQMTDIVLAPYQQHVGMSGILLHAAAAQKPVLSSDYGLMGEVVRRYKLGLTVDSTRPEDIAKGLTQCLLKDSDTLGDRARMQAFADENQAERFASTVFQHLNVPSM
ncbi:glycosyltransferase [Oculatella sp. LEGE 06141]|uniref:glycosyltransferase family 4 protein n=1 Tax=Oculatella sp. LEGE 06141 TaxID=1828648 RepID=UPI001880225C|nr:glycosyltransferase family 4 protein [Oculatella sp. LEGE 06141]MBE9178835.1 glycosyltransferase [Oculatella sp. LEGE 06141]